MRKKQNFYFVIEKVKATDEIPQMHAPFVQICIIIASFQLTCLFILFIFHCLDRTLDTIKH